MVSSGRVMCDRSSNGAAASTVDGAAASSSRRTCWSGISHADRPAADSSADRNNGTYVVLVELKYTLLRESRFWDSLNNALALSVC